MPQGFEESSIILSWKYDFQSECLTVNFRNGAIYDYWDVPEQVIEDFREAESKGQFFNHFIRNNYAYERQR